MSAPDFDTPHRAWDEYRKAKRRERFALAYLTIGCMVVLALFVLASCGPSDARAESAAAPTTTTEPEVRSLSVAEVDGPTIVPETTTTTTVPPTTTTAVRPPTTTTTVPVPTTAPPAPEPVAAAPAPDPAPSGDGRLGDPDYDGTWYSLRECEAPDWAGGWAANTGNGYYGGLQFALSSWQAVGGTGYPHEASIAEQIKRGRLLHAEQGWGAWPSCSRQRGWR